MRIGGLKCERQKIKSVGSGAHRVRCAVALGGQNAFTTFMQHTTNTSNRLLHQLGQRRPTLLGALTHSRRLEWLIVSKLLRCGNFMSIQGDAMRVAATPTTQQQS